MKKEKIKDQLDWISMIVPLAVVLVVCVLFMVFPEQ